MKVIRILLITFLVAAAAVAGVYLAKKWYAQKDVTDYASCVAAGNLVQESYPAVCVTPDGQRFTQPVEPDAIPR